MPSPFSIQPQTGSLCGGPVLCPGLCGCLWEIQGEWSACWQHETCLLLLLFIIVRVLVAQSCPTLCNPKDCSPSDSSVHGVLQARILEGLPFPSPGDLPDQNHISCMAGGFYAAWATREALACYYPLKSWRKRNRTRLEEKEQDFFSTRLMIERKCFPSYTSVWTS